MKSTWLIVDDAECRLFVAAGRMEEEEEEGGAIMAIPPVGNRKLFLQAKSPI